MTKATRKPAPIARKQSVTAGDPAGEVSDGVVEKQPQAMDQAALAQKVFLHDDDAWALQYYNQDDLHFLEREVFG